MDDDDDEIEFDEKLDFERIYNGELEKLAFNLSTKV